MATIFKNDKIEFKEDVNKIDNFRLFTASPRLANVVDSKNLIFDLRLLNPGQYSFPYHFHRNAEELMMITSGSMTLRSPVYDKNSKVNYFKGEENIAEKWGRK